ncbi:chemotaxis protein CheB [Mucilaginibacter lacusdianchii]|uniref:chemotaxis protein CheB n=1 Tax=Mucilaginibacter lacusdianchii TaxID=2684211 RepID=UPI00131D21ED|nr:chemotaxis protein CheB [Mucilaginibacter sp. JXJ CY 39]
MDYGFNVISIGSSAGGLSPLKEILSRLPVNLNAAVVLIPHLATHFESRLDHILSGITNLPVTKVTQDVQLERSKIYVMPEGKMMSVENGYLKLRDRLPSEKVNKAIDIFFKSLAIDAGNKSIGIILSGAGYDGIEGAKKIEDENGIVIVQDPLTAEFPLMPSALIANDHPDYVLTPIEIVNKVVDRVNYRVSF